MRDRQEAAGGEAVHHPPDQAAWVIAIGDLMQEADVQRGDGLIEVDEPLRVRVVQDVFGVPDVLQQERCAAVIGNKRLGMDRHDGVIVNVDNPRVGMGALATGWTLFCVGWPVPMSMNCRIP